MIHSLCPCSHAGRNTKNEGACGTEEPGGAPKRKGKKKKNRLPGHPIDGSRVPPPPLQLVAMATSDTTGRKTRKN